MDTKKRIDLARPFGLRGAVFKRILVAAALVVPTALHFAPQAAAQTYPSAKPLMLIVPFVAGSSTDALGRIVADGLSQTLGQKVIVENRAGAGGAIGLEALAKSAPDGYTLGVASTSTYVLSAALGEKKPYEILNDFVPVAITNDLPLMLASTAQIPPRSLKDLATHVRSQQTPFVSAGPGTSAHILGAAFVQATGGKGDAVHYKSSSAGIPDLLAGRVHFTVDGPGSIAPHVKDGKLIGMAVFATSRVPLLPDVPTVAEVWPEAPEFMKESSVNLILAPAKTPRDLVVKLNAAITRALGDPAIKERIERAGFFPRAPMSVEQVATTLRQSVDTWTRVVSTSGIKDAVKATSN